MKKIIITAIALTTIGVSMRAKTKIKKQVYKVGLLDRIIYVTFSSDDNHTLTIDHGNCEEEYYLTKL